MQHPIFISVTDSQTKLLIRVNLDDVSTYYLDAKTYGTIIDMRGDRRLWITEQPEHIDEILRALDEVAG